MADNGTRVSTRRPPASDRSRAADSDLSYGIAAIRLRAANATAEETLRLSEERYRSLFENMLDGFAYCEMSFENGRPRDFRYLTPEQRVVERTREAEGPSPTVRSLEPDVVAASMREAGAVDFVTKGGGPDALISAVHAAFRPDSGGE